ncbi:MAG: hypothetical protein GX767_02835 [Firmicutes bacterium]|nr:hypothetical protein [Bacillota bacterium]
MLNIQEQFRIFLSFLLLGALAGFVVDIYRAWCAVFLPCRKALFFLDLFLWLLMTALLLGAFFHYTWGEIRFALFIALGLGLILYFYLYSKIFLPFWFYIFCLAEKACAKIYKIISRIISWPCLVFSRRLPRFISRMRKRKYALKRRNLSPEKRK